MKYSPENQNIKPLMITILLTVLSVLCCLFASQTANLMWLLQLGFICFATVAIQIFLKFVLTTFEYVCDEEFFYIYKTLGKKTVLVGKLELANSVSLFFKISDSKQVEEYDIKKIKSIYSYTRNFQTTDIYAYVTNLGGKTALLKLELNDEFAEFANLQIKNRLKGIEQNEGI